MASPTEPSPSASAPQADHELARRVPAQQNDPVKFPAEERQRQAEQQRQDKRAAEKIKRLAQKEADLKAKLVLRDIARYSLARARTDSTEATRKHDGFERRQQYRAIIRMDADDLREEGLRRHDRIRLLLLPCVYTAIAGIVYGAATGQLKGADLQVACGAVGALIFGLLRDRFGLSLRVPFREEIGRSFRRWLDQRAALRDLLRLLTEEDTGSPDREAGTRQLRSHADINSAQNNQQ